MIHIIHKILVLIKNQVNYLKDNNYNKNYNKNYLKDNTRSEKEKIIKNIRNFFRLKKGKK